jgi:bacilliredoxin
MPYDPVLLRPMREELTRLGFEELLGPADVDRVLGEDGPILLVVNSVCGCAAGIARPGVGLSLDHPAAPKRRATVFAGQDLEATQRARSYLAGNPPSSPQVAVLSKGRLLFLLQRWQIEGRTAEQVAAALKAGYEGLAT